MRAYCISGLGADERVYEVLTLDYELVHLPWIPPLQKETLASYALRLGEGIDRTAPFVIIGVSFGGLIAVELAKVVLPQKVLLISSIEIYQELSWVYRGIGKLGIVGWIPVFCFNLPFWFARFFFGTKNPLLQAILRDSDPAFTRWAIQALLTWKNKERPINSLVISGEKDLLLSSQQPDYLIKQGHHFMIVDRAEELSCIINKEALDRD
ncbi:MAG: alpha/beta hydrolase [Aureispira sp.]